MERCHNCRYHLENEGNPYLRCLQFYNQFDSVEKIKLGLIGKCEEYKPILEYDNNKT